MNLLLLRQAFENAQENGVDLRVDLTKVEDKGFFILFFLIFVKFL